MKVIVWLVACWMVFFGCATTLHPIKSTPATFMEMSAVHQDLLSLPPPKEKIVVAVYKFRDQTGQYKASSTGMTWSTAVTQGATSMLLKAMEDCGWFVTVEREGLANLLNERKIISATRENYAGTEGQQLPPLPPLLYAGITIEGGIISYETNTVTGGYGARYFGLGGHTEFRRDNVSIYLRSVATKTGRILNTVNTSKEILSQAVDVNLYRFIREKRLLEIEAGFSTNEPPQMCVLEAIEKAVLGLVVEGIISNNWELQTPEDIKHPVVQRYLQEKESVSGLAKNARLDAILASGYGDRQYGRGFGLGFSIGSHLYQGDFAKPEPQPGGQVLIQWSLSRHLAMGLNGTVGRIGNKNYFTTDVAMAELRGQYTLFPGFRFSPFLFGGGSAFFYRAKDKKGNDLSSYSKSDAWNPALTGGIGLRLFVTPSLEFQTVFSSHYTLTDELDGMKHGRLYDSILGGRLGVIYYLGR